MKRSRRRAMLLTLSVLAAGMALPGSAPADPPGCPGLYCLWTKENFNGKRLVIETEALVNMPSFMNNKASSLKSRLPADRAFFGFTGKNGGGKSICGDGTGDAADLQSDDFGNKISSTDVKSASAC